AVDQLAAQGGEDSRDLGRTQGGGNGERGRRHRMGQAGQALVGAALEKSAAFVVGPAGELADRAELHELAQLLATDEAIYMELGILVHLADADQAQVAAAAT